MNAENARGRARILMLRPRSGTVHGFKHIIIIEIDRLSVKASNPVARRVHWKQIIIY